MAGINIILWYLLVVLLGHSNKNNFLSAIQLNFQLPNVNHTINVFFFKDPLMVQAGNAEALVQLLVLTVIA